MKESGTQIKMNPAAICTIHASKCPLQCRRPACLVLPIIRIRTSAFFQHLMSCQSPNSNSSLSVPQWQSIWPWPCLSSEPSSPGVHGVLTAVAGAGAGTWVGPVPVCPAQPTPAQPTVCCLEQHCRQECRASASSSRGMLTM